MGFAQVLVVEDENIVARSIQAELRGMGYSVPALAATGEEAIRKAVENQPDVVLMDIVLKGPMDGIEAARVLRTRLDIPVVYLTAYGDEETLARAKATEPYGYLLKPFEEKELGTTIELTLYKHRIEKRLRETNQWLSATLRSIDNAVIATDGRNRLRLLNPVAEALTGWTCEEAVGKDLIEVCQIIGPDKRDVLLSLGTQALLEHRGLQFPDEARIRSRTGRAFPVEGCVAPLHDDEEQFTGLVVVFRDVTDRKWAEGLQRQSEEHLRHSQKMEAVSRLAGGVAHDFNNLLTAILGNASLLLECLPASDPNRQFANQIESAAVKAAEEVKRLLAFSGRAQVRCELVDLNQLAREALEEFQRNYDSRIVFAVEAAPDLWPVRGDRPQLAEMLRNLCRNAQEAMPTGGRLILGTDNVIVEEEHLRAEWQAQPGEFIRLRVSDTGRGIDPEVRLRMFEPFFTTKEAGRSAGLGLALVHGIVQEHGGWIECRTDLGRGTCFDIYLPRYWQQGAAEEPAAVAPPPN